MPILQVIVASTRPGRIGLPIATWAAEAASQVGAFDVELVDLAEFDLPLLDEPNHPRLRQYTKEHTLRWSETIARGDAFVIVHPEYNYSFNATIKNAIDYLHQEWADKPVAFVSYGGVSAGLRATQALKQVVTTLRMVPIFEAVPIPFAGQFLNDEGEFVPNEVITAGIAPMVNELARLHGALSTLRK
ncbi:NADPH-dependent FMN reductase [Winogradskya humida]|nr:NAD(P)H-dependent oxidoreductase [Actinoplanes humidus]